MSEQDRRRWNERYATRESIHFTPSASLRALAPRIVPTREDARALDLACGTGRNALLLAELGYTVHAWDVSDVAIRLLQEELGRRASTGEPASVLPRLVDLDQASLPVAAYDLVLDYYFLDRRLLPAMAAALRPGGLLLIETFIDGPRARQRATSWEYLLQPGELARAFAMLEVLEYLEDQQAETARLLARRPNQC